MTTDKPLAGMSDTLKTDADRAEWSCDTPRGKSCRNPHGCHCREITTLRRLTSRPVQAAEPVAKSQLAQIRTAVADYMHSEGCSCCSDYDAHHAHKATLGKLLRVKKYQDRSGYDFARYRTEQPTQTGDGE